MGTQFRWEALPWRDSHTGGPATADSDDCYATVHLGPEDVLVVHDRAGGVLGGHGVPASYDLRWIRSEDVRDVFMQPPPPLPPVQQ